MATSAQFAYDSSTRAGKGPIMGLEKIGPLQIAYTHGVGPASGFNSFVFQNTLGTNCQILHSMLVHWTDPTVSTPTSTEVQVKLFIVEMADTAPSAWAGILNVGLKTTETYFVPVEIALAPGQCLLALVAAPPGPPPTYPFVIQGSVSTII